MKRSMRYLLGMIAFAAAFSAPCTGQVFSSAANLAPVCRFDSTSFGDFAASEDSWDYLVPMAAAVRPTPIADAVNQAINEGSDLLQNSSEVVLNALESMADTENNSDSQYAQNAISSEHGLMAVEVDGPPLVLRPEYRASMGPLSVCTPTSDFRSRRSWAPPFGLTCDGKMNPSVMAVDNVASSEVDKGENPLPLECLTEAFAIELPGLVAAADSAMNYLRSDEPNLLAANLASTVAPFVNADTAAATFAEPIAMGAPPAPEAPAFHLDIYYLPDRDTNTMMPVSSRTVSEEEPVAIDLEKSSAQLLQSTARQLDWIGLQVLRAADQLDAWAHETIAK